MKKAQQKQFEQVKNKLESLLTQMEEELKLIPLKGNTSNDCQRTALQICLLEVGYTINGICVDDFVPNEYSGDFKLSYS